MKKEPKFKLPKKIVVAGKEYVIEEHPNEHSACAFVNPFLIKIGTKNKENTRELFLHEVVELILYQYDLRFSLGEGDAEDTHRFVFNHDEFSHVIRELACSLKGIKF